MVPDSAADAITALWRDASDLPGLPGISLRGTYIIIAVPLKRQNHHKKQTRNENSGRGKA
jgi:hypothetical protein